MFEVERWNQLHLPRSDGLAPISEGGRQISNPRIATSARARERSAGHDWETGQGRGERDQITTASEGTPEMDGESEGRRDHHRPRTPAEAGEQRGVAQKTRSVKAKKCTWKPIGRAEEQKKTATHWFSC